VFAEDFSLKSNDDLFAIRDQMRTMDNETRDAHRSERQSRMRNMDQSERDSMFADMGARTMVRASVMVQAAADKMEKVEVRKGGQ
jgi:hypothetical protein